MASTTCLDGGNESIAARIEQGFIGQRAAGNSPHHQPLHRPLTGDRVTSLLGDSDRMLRLHKSREVTLGCIVGLCWVS
jgi:hypothetical protein